MKAVSFLKYTDVMAVTIRSRWAYIWDVLSSSLFLAVIMFVFVQLWTVTYRTQGATIAGFSLSQMIWYLVATETIIMSMIQVHRVIEREIREGDVAIRLNKPYSYLLFHFSVFLGEAVIKAGSVVVVGGIVAYTMVGGIDFNVLAVPALLVTFVMTMALNFAYAAIIGLAAFWFEDVLGLFFIMDRGKWLLGGFLMPIALFPEPIATIARYLPFRFMIFDPAKLAIGFSVEGWLLLIGQQMIALLVIGGTALGLYRLGVRRLNLNGG